MKNKPRQGPDIEAIISGLSKDNGTAAPKMAETNQRENPDEIEHEGRLWDEFIDTLNDVAEESKNERSKLYAIDDDIVETLHQCNFGKPNVIVINSILRTFLIDNITRLREMHRPRSISLLDKYD